jgi:hypothetical protein
MTALLEQAISRATQLSEPEQDKVAAAFVETLNALDNQFWDCQFKHPQDALAFLVDEALAEYHAGRTIKVNAAPHC